MTSHMRERDGDHRGTGGGGAEALLEEYRRRAKELVALYETAGDLSSLRDVDQVLTAIVRRSRQLLDADVAYLMLIDSDVEETFMRVSEGTTTPEFMSIRLDFGEGIGGLVAKTGSPQWTADYRADPRFAQSLDAIIRAESLVAILGVPLTVGGEVTGVLFASDRQPRRFRRDEVALLLSLANHAAIAIENASLFEEAREAMRHLQAANERIEQHNHALERAAELHERLTELVLTGASLATVADTVADVLGGRTHVLNPDGAPLTSQDGPLPLPDRTVLTALAGRSAEVGGEGDSVLRVAPALAGSTRLGFLLHVGPPLAASDVRALERAAMVTALLLLDNRAHEEARGRIMGELLGELIDGSESSVAHVQHRARETNTPLPDPPYAVLIGIGVTGAAPSEALGAEAVRLALAQRGLARTEAGHVVLVLHTDDAARTAHDAAARLTAAAGHPVAIGAVGSLNSLTGITAAYQRAFDCAKALDTLGRHGDGATPEDLGPYALLLGDAGRHRIEGYVEEVIGRVLAHDAERNTNLFETLEAYFDAGGQVGRAAEALIVHVNTLYQRLARIDRLLGPGWRRGDLSLRVHLAVRLARLLRPTV